jgi:hypothetical protein
MKTFLKFTFLFYLLFSISLIYTETSSAGISLPWSTTFNCNEWEYGDSLNCDGIQPYGSWTCNGTPEQITSSANYSGGGGGRGQRHWKGDGSNENSGGLAVTFNSAQSEFWIRWYMRYQSGFSWSYLNYDKILYIHTGATSTDAIVEFAYGNSFSVYAQNGNGHNYMDTGWNTIMGGSTSDGKWHCYEIHLKMDTNGSNGVAELWVDGNKSGSKSNIDFGTNNGWEWFLIGSNQSSPNNGGCRYVDFDDIAISNTGYIGPITGGDGGGDDEEEENSPPSAPQGLQLK